ncbi:hypothetical protein BJV82DRAFT_673441 [Fennellomyces sp. T-0311]|nr:hypothetical protein BJV82DRAFT_673441 [Fennellomyces sp. T-0311]
MSRFPTSLPYDIGFQIASYLDQNDCVECLTVCHQWYVEVPSYTIDRWKSIEISPESWNKVNDCMLRCLGPHVQNVSVNKMDTSGVLKKLKRVDCAAHTLEIKGHGIQLLDSPKLISSIKQFDSTLRQLHFYDHQSVLAISDLLDHFPNLTHLTLIFNQLNHRYLSQPTVGEASAEGSSSNLIYLHLDAVLHFDDRITPILRRCPRLQALGFTPTAAKRLPADSLAHIFQLCPRIRCFSWNSPTGLSADYQAIIVGCNDVDLQSFTFHGCWSSLLKFRSTFAKAEHTLEHMNIVNSGFGVTTEQITLSNLRFPCLKSFTYIDSHMSPLQWDSLLEGFQDIRFVDIRVHYSGFPVKRFIEAVSGWKHIQTVKFQCLSSTSPLDPWNNLGMLSISTHLQTLKLRHVRITDRGLLDICKIPSLEISLHLSEDCQTSLEVLLRFATQLGNTMLSDLELIDFENLDDSVLERLARVKSISRLSIVANDLITLAGVKAFACHGGSGGGYRRVYLRRCRYIEGLWDTDRCSR